MREVAVVRHLERVPIGGRVKPLRQPERLEPVSHAKSVQLDEQPAVQGCLSGGRRSTARRRAGERDCAHGQEQKE